MTAFGLQEGLVNLVKSKFLAAKSSGALTFSSTEMAIVPVARLPVRE